MTPDITGQVFGRLTVESRHGSNHSGLSLWRVMCLCGTARVVTGGDLRSGHTKSCGCLNREASKARSTSHGMSQSITYRSWASMITRCFNSKNHAYASYGGRGICVAPQWLSFEAFLSDMGERPSLSHSLDRFPDMRGNYEPANCRWATAKQQGMNKRTTIHFIGVDGGSLSATDVVRYLAIPVNSYLRLRAKVVSK